MKPIQEQIRDVQLFIEDQLCKGEFDPKQAENVCSAKIVDLLTLACPGGQFLVNTRVSKLDGWYVAPEVVSTSGIGMTFLKSLGWDAVYDEAVPVGSDELQERMLDKPWSFSALGGSQ